MRYFQVHSIHRGLVYLAEIREDGEVVGLPVPLPQGTVLRGEDGRTWVVLRQVEKALGLNRRGAQEGFQFSLVEPTQTCP